MSWLDRGNIVKHKLTGERLIITDRLPRGWGKWDITVRRSDLTTFEVDPGELEPER